MVVVSDLPCEIIAQILENLGHVRALSPVRLACRHFDVSFREHRTRVLRGLLRTQIHGDILPYAIALEIEKPALGSSALTSFIQTLYDRPQDICSRLGQLSVEKLYSISRTHEAIKTLATEFSQLAWFFALATPSQSGYALPGYALPQASISATENVRIFRAFYRVELFLRLYGQILPVSEVPRKDGPVWFYGQHNPWECQQNLAVYEFLDDTVMLVSSRFGTSSMSSDESKLFHELSMTQGVRLISHVREKFPISLSEQEMISVFENMLQEPWLDVDSPRHDCDLSEYSDHNDSLMTALPRSNPEYSHRDNAVENNWAETYRHRQGIPDEMQMRDLRKAGFVFWDQPCEERIMCPMTAIFDLVSAQAEESGSEIDFDEDIFVDDDGDYAREFGL
ncbi:unnamed protein product [Clonostachys byssicola]|uniref:F-box domain-containing protein n=1 Tax=Clonostachys byssicola TaxID=160290 RepID=A0A9N9XV93_9HYPO|nr:unnamed protein product [Clonostachys byssicola]